TFTAKDLPSGVYIYRLDVNDFTATKKMVLMK
ncbi:T9SS type A sorting domain-containing protein, partial [bacterium]|nr:T9SS type A sorting domain-containing protein [bacterium]